MQKQQIQIPLKKLSAIDRNVFTLASAVERASSLNFNKHPVAGRVLWNVNGNSVGQSVDWQMKGKKSRAEGEKIPNKIDERTN